MVGLAGSDLPHGVPYVFMNLGRPEASEERTLQDSECHVQPFEPLHLDDLSLWLALSPASFTRRSKRLRAGHG